MVWWVNILLGFLIGSFAATYSEGYRNLFKRIFDKLSGSKKKSNPDEKKKK